MTELNRYIAPANKWIRWYQTIAILLVNTLVIFVVINLVFSFFLWFQNKRYGTDPVSAKYGSLVEQAYPGVGREVIRELLRETWNRGYVYEPFTYFKERPFTGKYVNVDPHGFRVTKEQGPWPPDRNRDFVIFLFGGSTSFAYGLPDDQTVASYLQESLWTQATKRRPRVYNFARGYYYSSQERIQYERLLASDFVPDVALFVDGLNEYYRPDDNPEFGDRLAPLLDRQSTIKYSLLELIKRLPVIEAARKINGLMRRPGSPPPGQKYDDPVVAHRIADRYMQNIRIIAAVSTVYGVRPLFVWQPVPTYRSDPRTDPFSGEDQFGPAYAKYGYPVMLEYAQHNKLGPDFVWCADIQEGIKEPLYVDKIHYSARLSKMLAGCISDSIVHRTLLEN